MNIKKFGKRLNKINNLFDSIKSDGEVSSIEKDLLLSYLREAYEYVHEGAGEESAQPIKKTYKEPEHHIPPPPPVKQEVPVEPQQPVLEKIVSEEIIRETVVAPSVVTEAPAAVAEPVIDVPQALVDIFSNEEASDLSDKLSMSPIKDMTKSMGINERIFTVKELFGGDTEIFNSILERINTFSSYGEAKNYLMTGIAKDQDWAAEDKIKKAEKFVKLVQRRFA